MTEQAAIRNIQSNTIQKLALLNIMPLKISVMICLLRLHYLMATITVSVSPVFTVVANPVFLVNPIVKGKSPRKSFTRRIREFERSVGRAHQ